MKSEGDTVIATKTGKVTASFKRVYHNGPSGSSLEGFFAKAKRSKTDNGLGHNLQIAPIGLTSKLLPSGPF